jgi:histidyl-tRNA synthetase
MNKPSIPKGTRDFSPVEVIRRNYIFDQIKQVFQKHAFSPIETPSFEKLDTLNGKYGEEGDQLLFKILMRGAKFNKALEKSLTNRTSNDNHFSEEALRYDLTVPFARYIVQHQNDINFPFKRYQIQPVWRADRPQKGRYREFYQCDADIVGTHSLNCEVELVSIINNVLNKLNLSDHTIFINNRKILSALIDSCGASDYFKKVTIIIDKIDKIGTQKVVEELRTNVPENQCAELFNELFSLGDNEEILINWLNSKIEHLSDGKKGIDELLYVLSASRDLGCKTLKVNLSLARGLDYYTGSIFEVTLNNHKMGSIVGGGRYDNLTQVFGQRDLSGVGVSFGAERIYDVMNDLNLFPDDILTAPNFMIINQSNSFVNSFKLSSYLMEKGYSCFVYPDEHKLKKQLKYANDSNISRVIFISEKFNKNMMLEVKEMESGSQTNILLKDL